MTKDLRDPVDNGTSFASLYGLSNPVTTWLINRGYGELVALAPEEMQRPEASPSCKAQKEAPYQKRDGSWAWQRLPGQCGGPMRYRPEGWVCYEHEKPVRVKRAPRMQKLPEPPFSTFDVIGKTVELHYARGRPGEGSRWVWLVDGVEWRS